MQNEKKPEGIYQILHSKKIYKTKVLKFQAQEAPLEYLQ